MRNKFNANFAAVLFFVLLCAAAFQVQAQCGTTITTFPYAEDFETSQGGWASGGTNNDWAWGTPAKSVITGAGSGTKCWITGGLTGDFYKYGERSYVTSPCFDFSALQYPMIDFLIFWDSEHTWDGMTLQSSIDGGNTWVNVGAYGDSVNCENQNWYNTVTCAGESGLVNVENAWTGNNLATSGSCQGGFGSLKWVNAKHCLTGLGGQASVMFRFAFGAGTTCNDFNGIAFDSVGIGESPVISDSFMTTCLGNSKVSFTGITSECPNVFAWNFGDPGSGASNTSTTINPTHTFSAPGSYTVSFTASGPCNAPATYTSIVNVLGVTDTVHGVACFGQSNGSINLGATGGITPYTFSWGNGATTQDITGLAAGTYIFTVSDPHGCAISDTVLITQPPVLKVTDTSTNASCLGNNGAINITVTGGTPVYAYNWGGGITSQNRSGLGAGTYTVTVTDANACTATAGVTISSAAALSAAATATNVTCFNAGNGTITVTDTGGIAPYTYNWGGGITTQNRNGLSAGTYTVTVTDHSGCTATASATVTQPALPLTVTLTPVNATCTVGGSITTTVTGGSPGYTYSWGGGVTSQNRTGLGAGTYTVTVADINDCTATASVVITSSATIQIADTVTGVTCNGLSTGAIAVTASGGAGGFTYSWGAGITSQIRTGLSAGTYDVTVTDLSNCTASASIVVTQPSVLTPVAVPVNIACFGGTNGAINLTDTGGTAPYTYNWGGGITSQNRTGLSAGTYTVTVTDNKGCTATTSATINQSQQLLATDSASNVLCFGGSTGVIVVSASGGTMPYSYNWGAGSTTNPVQPGLAAGSYSVTVTDSVGCTAVVSSTITQPVSAIQPSVSATTTACDSATGTVTLTVSGGTAGYTFSWSNGATTQNIASLISNAYSVTVTDLNGCTATASTHVSQTAGPVITLISTPDSCHGASNGNINSIITGGTPGYTYSWSNSQISSSISDLAAGVYTVTVTDAHSCTAVASDSVTSPTALLIFLNVTPAKCFGDSDGAVQVTASGGTAPYFYQWSNNDSTANANNLVANTYQLTVSDVNLCSATFSAIVGQPTAISVSTITDSATCGLPTGKAQVTVSGGNQPYIYAWQPAVSDSSTAVNLSAGHYQVTITDSSGCPVLDTFSVGGKTTAIVPPYLGPDTTICPGNGNIILNAGVYPAYFWQDSSTAQHYTVTDTGTFWVIVTDSNGCKSSDSIVVTQMCTDKFVIPNAFTPNGDGKNDFFIPMFIDVPAKYYVHIYNRWGAEVFQSSSTTIGWDGNYHGKAQPVGTYIYYIQYTYTGQKEQSLYGAVELLR